MITKVFNRYFKNTIEREKTDLLKLSELEHPSMQNELAPMIWSRTDNFEIYNCDGRKWIDFTASVAVANSGHANKKNNKCN